MIMGLLGSIVTLLFLMRGEWIFSLFVPEKEAYVAGGNYLLIIGSHNFS